MKKLIFVALCFVMAITAYASSENKYSYDYESSDITIVFDENTAFDADERQTIADYIVNGGSEDENVSAQSLCWLTGHKITSDSVIEIQHKVRAKAPRCYKTIYQVDKCSKCDYVEKTVLNQAFIACCAED